MRNYMNEQLDIKEDMPIIARNYNYNYFKYPWHFHDEYEIIYISEGTGERFVADAKGRFNPGDIIFLGTNLPHCLKCDNEYLEENSGLRVKGTIIQFKKDFMKHSIQNYADLKNVKSLLERSAGGLYFPSSSNKELIHRITALPKYKGIRRLVNLLVLLDKMASIKEAVTIASQQYNIISSFTDNRLEKILSYIRLHCTEELHIERIASLIPMNTTSFCRYFKDKTDKTFTEYINDLRIGLACKLLLERSNDISQICFDCGFNTTTHFNRIFKRNTGLTPTDYRKNFLKNQML